MDENTQDPANPIEPSARWSITRIIGILLILGAAVTVVYLVVGYLAWQSGQTLRGERELEQRGQQFTRQITLAQGDIESGSYNLALHRLDWVLERDPSNANASALRAQAQAALKTSLTPIAPPTATPLPEPTINISEEANPQDEIIHLQRLYDQEQWTTLISSVDAFQRQFPNFDRPVTDRLLYEGHLNLGLQQVQSEQIEQGLAHLSAAEKLGDLPQEALDYWLWSELYLEGIAYYGVNWGVSTAVFRDLCLSAPFFQNACDKLYESLVNYADLFFFNEDYCPAVNLFRESRQYGNDDAVSQKLTKAVEGCALATPTPAPITGTLPVTGTEPLPLPGQ